MPNYCFFDMRVKGKKKNILKLFDFLNADYQYLEYDEETHSLKCLDKPKCFIDDASGRRNVDHHIGYRVFELDYDESELNQFTDSDALCMDAYGNCAWSCYTCMFEGHGTYIDDNKELNNSLAIALPTACKMLELEVEIFSEESGMCFAEHFLIDSEGSVIINETAAYLEFFIEEFKDYDTYRDYIKEDFGCEPGISRRLFDMARGRGESSVGVCVFLREDGEWKFILSKNN